MTKNVGKKEESRKAKSRSEEVLILTLVFTIALLTPFLCLPPEAAKGAPGIMNFPSASIFGVLTMDYS